MSTRRVIRVAEPTIHIVRGQRVMLDSGLGSIYKVTTKRLNEQLPRNLARFPRDTAFRLTGQDLTNLRSQIATSSYGGRRYLPRVFTEHGAIMPEKKREIGFHVREGESRFRARENGTA